MSGVPLVRKRGGTAVLAHTRDVVPVPDVLASEAGGLNLAQETTTQ
jgi:hypothetical protein